MTLRDQRDRTAHLADLYGRMLVLVTLERIHGQPVADRVEGRRMALAELWREIGAEWPGANQALAELDDLAAHGLIRLDDPVDGAPPSVIRIVEVRRPVLRGSERRTRARWTYDLEPETRP